MQLTKRRLTDLWVVGRELTLDDGQGEPVTVWIQKLNSAEMAEANRRCDAARARVLATRNTDSDEWAAIEGSVREYVEGDKQKAIDFLLIDERTKAQRVCEMKVASEEEWSKDNYLQGLFDSWRDGLEKRWLSNNEDAEASRVQEELTRFASLVSEVVEAEMDVLKDAWSQQSLGELMERMALKLLDMDANQAWMKEMWSCQIFFGVRDSDDKKARYFESREEVDTLAAAAYEALHQAYQNLEVDVVEGKGSPAPQDSSPSSEVRNEAEMVASSGPVAASR